MIDLTSEECPDCGCEGIWLRAEQDDWTCYLECACCLCQIVLHKYDDSVVAIFECPTPRDGALHQNPTPAPREVVMARARDPDSKRNLAPRGKRQQQSYRRRRRQALDLLRRVKSYDDWVNEAPRTDADKTSLS